MQLKHNKFVYSGLAFIIVASLFITACSSKATTTTAKSTPSPTPSATQPKPTTTQPIPTTTQPPPTTTRPKPKLSSVAVMPSGPASLQVGLALQFNAVATYSDGSTADVTDLAAWSSSNPAVASITSGLAQGLAAGSTNIAVSFSGQNSSPITLTVVSP